MARTLTQRRDGKTTKSRQRAAAKPEALVPPTDETKLFPTKNDLPEDKRVEVIGLLNQRLAEAIDLQTQCKQAHWNVKGPSFIGLHKLFDEVNEDIETYVDLIAERVVQLGGIAEGTIGAVEQRSKLPDYPIGIAAGPEHVAALSDALGAFGRAARITIAEMDELEDADSMDMLTDTSRGIDKWLWFVEAHQQAWARPGPSAGL